MCVDILTERAIKNEWKETYSIVGKITKWYINTPMETTNIEGGGKFHLTVNTEIWLSFSQTT